MGLSSPMNWTTPSPAQLKESPVTSATGRLAWIITGYLILKLTLSFIAFSLTFFQYEKWRLSTVNRDYSVCPSYPPAVIVPKSIDDDTLKKAAKFRQGGRFPVLCYYHKKNGMVRGFSVTVCGRMAKSNVKCPKSPNMNRKHPRKQTIQRLTQERRGGQYIVEGSGNG